jgi:hypothetical protein
MQHLHGFAHALHSDTHGEWTLWYEAKSAWHHSRAEPAPTCTCLYQPTVRSTVVAKSQRGLQPSLWWALSVTRLSRLASWGALGSL